MQNKAMPASAEFSVDKKQDCWVFSGNLDISALSQYWHILQNNIPKSGEWIWDFSDLNRIDSAGLAAILHAIKTAKKTGLIFKITHFLASAQTLIKAQGLSDIINPYIVDHVSKAHH